MLNKSNLVPVLQNQYELILGVRISKDKAWELFKATLNIPYDILLENWNVQGRPALAPGVNCDALVMSLAGVGRFEVKATGSREEGAVANPRPRFYPSSSILKKVQSFIENEGTVDAPKLMENASIVPQEIPTVDYIPYLPPTVESDLEVTEEPAEEVFELADEVLEPTEESDEVEEEKDVFDFDDFDSIL